VIDQPVLRWALTAVFAVAAVLFVVAGRRASRCTDQTGVPFTVWTLHALASIVMIAMLWPVGMQVSPLLYVLVFTGCALYFAYLALFGDRLPHPIYHCTMMAAMALMGLLMSPNSATPPMTHAGHQMSHGSHMAMAEAAQPMPHLPTPTWLTATSITLAVGFAVASVWWFYLLVRGPQRPYADMVMALGMSAAFAAMAA
jgi:hypothetical protein